jgi:hypothetical protein
MTSELKPFSNYEAFWPFYLSQHSRRATRLVHVAGTCLALLALVAGIAGNIGWLLAAPVVGYGVAWIAHAFIEKNRPATFTHPLWSLLGDFHMLWLWLTGRLEIEVVRRVINDGRDLSRNDLGRNDLGRNANRGAEIDSN